MKFRSEKKQSIIIYMLEKISKQEQNLTTCVSETFGISMNTVHLYLKELIAQNIIEKPKRGVYQLVEECFRYDLKRSEGHLSSDTYAYLQCLQPHILDLPDNVQRIWSYGFSEMVNNVMDHSAAENLTVIVRKNYLQTRATIIDDGVGIFEKIKNHFHLADLNEAICELFKGKLTTDEENHSGEGIFFTSKMMDAFLILSDGRVFTTDKYESDSMFDLHLLKKGTCVCMALSNITHREPRDIFDLYSNQDGGFTKTRIPLKNIFDTAPVSRSQAKRIYHRLDAFKEAILDFEGLEWMGQGFAHQLFVVYQNAHPDITLTPINMSEGVRSMYRHVLPKR